MNYGYGRVSTNKQELDIQIKALKEKGVKFGRKSKIHKIEGALLNAIQQVKAGTISQPEGLNLQSVVLLHLRED
ncbi:hypothetical protein PDL70_16925 [Bacillus cereus]|nr:hypothetical protein [Bacillus cereus]ANC11287.1 hypothetical protein WR47_29825 [Bacillus cereus]ANC16948.1 hypothetical protein WR51_28840 [Bacillus cereus]MDA1994819.1 hypothetical protein [Bacillus cereus]MDA2000939.1 hypothetical protein [Bacillus cereus]MDA3654124.1 hypothetical protein [Bacillus cereus]